MSDNQELEALLRAEKVELPPWEWREWLHYPDVNQGSYQNQINFDGQTASNHWQCLSDAYVVIPISVSSSTGTAYTSTTVLAPKDGGIDNLITAVLDLPGCLACPDCPAFLPGTECLGMPAPILSLIQALCTSLRSQCMLDKFVSNCSQHCGTRLLITYYIYINCRS